MPEQRLINTARSADLVTTKVIINGAELSHTIEILSIVVEKEINRIPTARLVITDGDPAVQDFSVSNQELFVPGNEIEITAGYHFEEEVIFKGIIIKQNLKIRTDHSLLIVECKDITVKLTIDRKSKYFTDKKDSEIIEEIISVYAIENEIESTDVQQKEMVQFNVSDWDFCVLRAQVNGKICIADDGKLKVKSPGYDGGEVETVAFGATLLDFDAEMDARTQLSGVTGYSWDYAAQELVQTEAAAPSVNLNGNIASGDLASVMNAGNIGLRSGGATPVDELQQWVDAKALFSQLAKVRGRVKFQGIPAVKPDTVLKIEGVGDRFNGKVYVTGVRHQITEGNWTVDAQFGVDTRWFTETVNISDLPAAGLNAAVNGLQTGVVTQLESDPDGEDRILVKLPVVDNEVQGTWARVSTLDAGENRGSFFRPEIGDEVIVGFINANPNDAVVLGMLNSSAKPAPIVASDDNHEKGFFTRSEMKLVFNDDKKSVLLETPAGKKISVDEDAGVIQLEDENGNKFTLNSDGVTIESCKDVIIKATGDVKIEGINIELKASAQLKAEGSAGAELSSGATATVKGSIVQIN
ncbi:MAG TPA: Rhs element Vgr protein [Prolixibacteraceae bacterium]|nr:Rhs element Vgr protein [Prolixibacteraceae bacterium]